MYPTVGRIVHFYYDAPSKLPTGEPLAAIIVSVSGLPDPHGHKHDCTERCAVVNLMVITQDAGTRLMVSVPYAESPASLHWNWPPR